MTLFWKRVIWSVLLGLVLPGIIFTVADEGIADPSLPPAEEEPVWIPVIGEDGQLTVMELEHYVSRVVLGEMPGTFHMEALKAQAVAARTYTLWTIREGQRHHGAVCTDHKCCQAFREPEEYLEDGGTQQIVDKIFTAVEQTGGQVVYYEEDLIMATYFACAGGRTEDAKAVWGKRYPYLRSVSSPERTKYDGETVCFRLEEFFARLGQSDEQTLDGLIGAMTYTPGGGVASVQIGQERYTGTQLRSEFGLRSTALRMEVTEDEVIFHTNGYGHRVGLSQYGADALADQGMSFDQILGHYYPGTTVGSIRND